MADDIRWKQRFHDYTNALQTLTEAVALGEQRPLTKLEKQGLIQGFELTHELGWNVLKDYLQSKGYTGIIGITRCHTLGTVDHDERTARRTRPNDSLREHIARVGQVLYERGHVG